MVTRSAGVLRRRRRDLVGGKTIAGMVIVGMVIVTLAGRHRKMPMQFRQVRYRVLAVAMLRGNVTGELIR